MNSIKLIAALSILTFALISCDDSSDDNNGVVVQEEFVFDNLGSGCSSFLVYETNEHFHSLHISGNREELGISTTPKTFALPLDQLNVAVNEFDGEIGNYYCDDVLGDEGTIINTYTPNSGTAEVVITQDSISVYEWEVIYEVSITLKDLIFVVGDNIVTIESKTYENVRVGWFPG
jgi:hypothetical protein